VRLYLDANAIIYAIEGAPPFRDAVVARITQVEGVAGAALLTSRLSRLECRIKPMRQGDVAVLAKYDKFLGGDLLLLGEIDAETIEHATDLRVRYNVKTADAIHLATALNLQADVFLTGDATLSRCAELKVEVL
jgi:uncharacterized protein